MRLKVVLEPKKTGYQLPLNYMYPLSAAVYRIFSAGSDEGAFCSGTFNICIRGELPYDTYLEFTRISPLQWLEDDCTSPCEFYQCSDLMPIYFEVDTHRPNETEYLTFKQTVNIQGSSNYMELSPNPATNLVNIKIAVQESGVYQLNVIDNIGNTVHTQSIIVGSGLMFELDLTTQEYVSGNYNIVLTNNSGLIINQQFIKIK